MKFHQLSMGQRFEFEGDVYVRTRPLIAVHEASGQQRFIRRSASVKALPPVAAPATLQKDVAAQTGGLGTTAVREAFDDFYARCLLGFDELEGIVDSERIKQLRGNLEVARRRFLESLSL